MASRIQQTEMSPKKVLIVEDDLSLKPFWEFVLLRNLHEYHLDWAVDSESAKSIYLSAISNGEAFDLIVIDLFISGPETGLDILNMLDHFEDTTRVLLVSSVNNQKLKGEVKDYRLNIEILTKPLSPPLLDQLLDSRRPLPSNPAQLQE